MAMEIITALLINMAMLPIDLRLGNPQKRSKIDARSNEREAGLGE